MYCSQIWRPQLIRCITTLKCVQRRATKYILNDYISSYKSRLLQLNLLPLMYIYELNDLMFLIKSLNTPTDNFDIKDFISFNTSSTRQFKLCHPRALSTNHHHFYFNRIARLWNNMPVIDISLPSHVIKRNLTIYLWNSTTNFNSDHSCTCTYHYLCPCHWCSRQPTSSNFHNLISATDTNNHLITNMWITVQSTVCIPVLSGCGHRQPTDLQSRSSCFVKH